MDGTVIHVQPYVLNGKAHSGSIVQIQPGGRDRDRGNLDQHLPVDVGSPCTRRQQLLGKIVDLSKLLHQTVANYTSDSGNHVSMQVTAGASPLL